MLKIRPYETEPGSTDKAYNQCLQMVINAIEQGHSEKRLANELMPACTQILASVNIDKSHPKPRICVVGEIYTRLHNIANGDAVRQLEALGMEVELAGFAEWLYYTNFTRKLMAKRWRDPKLYLQNLLKDYVQHKIEKKIARAVEAHFGPLAEGDIWEVVKNAAPYIHHSFEGEAALTIGKIIESAHHGAAGAVNIMPFTCMPSTIVSGILRQVTEDFHGLPVLNISYDGQQDPTLQTRMEAFTHQATVFAQQSRNIKTNKTPTPQYA
jgi:predicted nucleotide-binding protein (sugar kinase/HSP70/actin superfamily)